MLVGNASRFAIEAKPEEYPNEWILGRFRFWVGGEAVGNWDDWADLKGCVRWLRDFEQKPRDHFDPRLESLDAEGVFKLLYDPVFGPNAVVNPPDQPVPNAYARFHIAHLGMSSFERFDILLVTTAQGKERCLWRSSADRQIRDVLLEPGEMERVAKEFCDRVHQGALRAP